MHVAGVLFTPHMFSRCNPRVVYLFLKKTGRGAVSRYCKLDEDDVRGLRKSGVLNQHALRCMISSAEALSLFNSIIFVRCRSDRSCQDLRWFSTVLWQRSGCTASIGMHAPQQVSLYAFVVVGEACTNQVSSGNYAGRHMSFTFQRNIDTYQKLKIIRSILVFQIRICVISSLKYILLHLMSHLYVA